MSNSSNITGESLLYLTDNQLRQGIEAMFFAYRGFTADPDKILEELDRKIINGLSNENGVERQDGMDMSIVTINAKKQRLYFAGAKNPLYIIYKDEIDIKKGSFFPVGSK